MDSRPSPSSSRIRIVHSIGTMDVGGAERQLAELIGRLPKERYDQSLVLFREQGAFLERVRGAECDVIGLRPPRPPGPPKNRISPAIPMAMLKFVAYLRRRRPHILHAQLAIGNIAASIAGRMAGVPVILTSRLNLCPDREAKTLLQKAENLANRSAAGVFANSKAVMEDAVRYEGVDPAKVRVIYNGVELDRFAAQPPDKIARTRAEIGLRPEDRALVCVANLHPYKGHEDLIRAYAELGPNERHLKLLLLGRDAGSGDALKKLARELRVEPSVKFMGQQGAVEDFLAVAEFTVHPSHEEGFSNAILEAMASGRAVVACAVGGNVEAIVEGETGRLVPPRDPASFGAAMDQLVRDPEKARAMGEAARRRAEANYGMDAMIEEFDRWYTELAGRLARV